MYTYIYIYTYMFVCIYVHPTPFDTHERCSKWMSFAKNLAYFPCMYMCIFRNTDFSRYQRSKHCSKWVSFVNFG